MPGLEPLEELAVGGDPVQAGHLGEGEPAGGLAFLGKGCRVSREAGVEEPQAEGAAAGRVEGQPPQDPDGAGRAHAQFFFQFAAQAGGQRLARLALAAGKFPLAGLAAAGRALGQKETPPSGDDGGAYIHCIRCISHGNARAKAEN